LAGHSHICEKLTFVGIDAPGSLQQRWVVPQDLLVELPGDMSLRDAALVEPVAVAHHDVERARLSDGESVVVVGGGPVGLLIALVARTRGAEVTVVELDAFRRKVIAELGFAVADPRDKQAAALLADGHSGAGVDVVFEVSGSQPGLTLAIETLRPRGRLVVVGIHSEPRSVDLKAIFWKELEIYGARVYRRTDYEAAVNLIAGGHIPVDALVSRIVPLTDASEAFAELAQGGEVMKVLIDVQGETTL
jgi:2-desacetyl-2-hydroxyethyl bacteriochlorophyllide A dehydrogenase